VKTVLVTAQEDSVRIQAAALKIATGNLQKSSGEKLTSAGKDFLARWLEENRLIVVDDLPIGESVLIKCQGVDVLRVDIGKQNKVDVKALEIEESDVAERFKRDFPMRLFKPLIADDVLS
jgi:hypothetical protein